MLSRGPTSLKTSSRGPNLHFRRLLPPARHACVVFCDPNATGQRIAFPVSPIELVLCNSGAIVPISFSACLSILVVVVRPAGFIYIVLECSTLSTVSSKKFIGGNVGMEQDALLVA